MTLFLCALRSFVEMEHDFFKRGRNKMKFCVKSGKGGLKLVKRYVQCFRHACAVKY